MTLIKHPENKLGLRSAFPELFDFNTMFNSPFFKENGQPAVNIRDNKDHFELELAAPGLSKKDFNINIENGILTVSHEKSKEQKEEKPNYTHCEFSYRSFTRSFTLPEAVNEDKVKADYKDGVLHIRLPKREEAVSGKSVKKVEIS